MQERKENIGEGLIGGIGRLARIRRVVGGTAFAPALVQLHQHHIALGMEPMSSLNRRGEA